MKKVSLWVRKKLCKKPENGGKTGGSGGKQKRLLEAVSRLLLPHAFQQLFHGFSTGLCTVFWEPVLP
ncbi:MAG: hypothetical protein MR605_05025 [Bacteroidales bacterium]|nr:hypothetical protein [Bacteroidales bacterium]